MKTQKLVIVIGTLVVIAIGGFLVYLYALSSAYTLHKSDNRPFFITAQPMVVKHMVLPKGTKIIYEGRYFWEKWEQKKPLDTRDIIQISFDEGTTLDWGGVPIAAMVRFYNTEMKGFTVYGNFNMLTKETRFSNLWKQCDDGLGISIQDTNDWSFNKSNIVDVESCGVGYQRYFKEDEDQQAYLNELYRELMKISE